MTTYLVTAINVGSFHLGEADKVLTLFSKERGIIKAVAKGARKPGTKTGGRADLLNVNKLMLARGRTFEIITQAESVETFPELRKDLSRLAYGLYYAELTQQFGVGLGEDTGPYFEYLLAGLTLQARAPHDPAWLCLQYELGLLDMLGYRPELTYCVNCREVLGDYNLGSFDREAGGVVCQNCTMETRRLGGVAEGGSLAFEQRQWDSAHITPLVWKNLVLALETPLTDASQPERQKNKPLPQSVAAARRLIQGYIEHRAGKRMKALDLLDQLKTP
jgi:DNA repair protein RecO (recombination protein O)